MGCFYLSPLERKTGRNPKRDSGSNIRAPETSHRLNDTQMTEAMECALCHGGASVRALLLFSPSGLRSVSALGSLKWQRVWGGEEECSRWGRSLFVLADSRIISLPIGVMDTFPQGLMFPLAKMIRGVLFNPRTWRHHKAPHDGASQRAPDLWPSEHVYSWASTHHSNPQAQKHKMSNVRV